jgi:hypothetical protein
MFWQKMKEKNLPLKDHLSLPQTLYENCENLGALKDFMIPLLPMVY